MPRLEPVRKKDARGNAGEGWALQEDPSAGRYVGKRFKGRELPSLVKGEDSVKRSFVQKKRKESPKKKRAPTAQGTCQNKKKK